MQTTSFPRKLQEIKKNTQIEPMGYDGGFGAVKLTGQSSQVMMPSYLLPVTGELYGLPDTEQGCLIEYIDGTAEKLIGKRWFAGQMASIQSPNSYIKITDDRLGKITYGLQILLGAIALTKPLQKQTLSIMASIQDAQAWGAELKSALEGIHYIKVNQSWETCLNVRIEKVLEEGVGTSYYCRQQGLLESGSKAGMLDLGNGTTIASILSGGNVIQRKVFPDGVQVLVETICGHIDVRKRLGEEGKPHLVRAGLERGDLIYGRGRNSWSFASIYQESIAQWGQLTLAPALKMMQQWNAEHDVVIATGGGSKLPGIEKILSKRGIEVLPDGVFANSRGLYGLAQMKQRRIAS